MHSNSKSEGDEMASSCVKFNCCGLLGSCKERRVWNKIFLLGLTPVVYLADPLSMKRGN